VNASSRGPGPLVVVYGLGSAGPVDILRSARDDIPVLLLSDSGDAHTARARPLIEFFDDRIDLAADDVDTVVRHLRSRSPAGIVTFSERMLPLTADLAERLGLASHSPAVARAVTDKAVQRQLLAASPLLTTPFAVLDADAGAVEAIGLPAVVKPVRGEGGTNVRLLRQPSDVATLRADLACGDLGPMLVEAYLADAPHPAGSGYGSYVSVEAFVVDGKTVHWGITDKLRPADPFFETGSISPSRLGDVLAADVRNMATEAVRLLGIVTGCVHVEIKLTPSGPKVIEVNGRLGGSVAKLMAATYGWDAVRATMEVALGRDPVLPGPPTAATVVVHVPTSATAPPPITPRLRERVRAVPGVLAVDNAVDDRMLIGRTAGGVASNTIHRLVDLTLVGPDSEHLWSSLSGALAVLRDGGAEVTEEFMAATAELRSAP
jgi:biotin carboxylase